MAPGTGRRRGRRRRVGTALFAAVSCSSGAGAVDECGPRLTLPGKAPNNANHYNGIGLKACLNTTGPHHVFVISDWGGQGDPPEPVGQHSAGRKSIPGVDDCAQQRVAEQMRRRAATSNPDFVLNAGDNFYWGGIQTLCGARPYVLVNTHQWGPIYEQIYHGPGLDGKQWLGVLGNHDYGGYTFAMGWDQVIGYSWGGPPPNTGRWMTPAQYWSASVTYPGFSVDYVFMDTNVYNAFEPNDDPEHNICSLAHSPSDATCGEEGPQSVWDCPKWFRRLWRNQTQWVQRLLSKSEADWQIIVTHFPPTFGRVGWERLVAQHGVDLIVSGHVHQQEVHYMEPGNFLHPTAWIISGGGGGITSEGTPDVDGADDQYGFFDLSLSKEEIVIEAISHGGKIRSTTKVLPRKASTTDVQLGVLEVRKDVVVDVEDDDSEVDRAGGVANLSVTSSPNRIDLRMAGPPHGALLARHPAERSGGNRSATGMMSLARNLEELAARFPLDSDRMLLGASYGALACLTIAIGVSTSRFLWRDRFGCRLLELAEKHLASVAPGYSRMAAATQYPTQESGYGADFETKADVGSDAEAMDEFREPPDMGCFNCWPRRSNIWRYQRLQTA